jgi:hypothetical protein
VVALLAVSANAAPFETSSDHIQKFRGHDPRPYPPSGDAGGETYATSVDMVALPFSDSGDLFAYTDDIDFGFGTSPDCVYHYTPDFDGCITVDLCASSYDSMVFVVDEAFNIVAWNDDGMDCGPASQISWMNVYSGVLYYYVIDGWGGWAGDYDIQVFERDCPPPPECPPGAILEGEGCADPYDDFYDSGCNGAGYIELGCTEDQIVCCGTIFNYESAAAPGTLRRDTDWYLLDLTGDLTITSTSYYESSGSLYYICIPSTGCADSYIPYGIHLGSRELGTLAADLTVLDEDPESPWFGEPQEWAIFQSKNYYDGTWYDCLDPEAWPYVLTVDGLSCGATPTETDTWGGVKNLFK